MKKILVVILILMLVLSFAACGGNTENDGKSSVVSEKEVASVSSIEELDELVIKDVDGTISILKSKWETLATDIDSYDKYKEKYADVESFYNEIIEETNQLCTRLHDYSIKYAETILASEKSYGEKYDDFDALYDAIYEDAKDKIYDEIYDGVMAEMYDAFYDGVIQDAYDDVKYGEWSETSSNEYDIWSDSHSEVYEVCSDMGSNVYEFWSDMRSEMYNKDEERAKEKLEKFKAKVEKQK